MDAYCERRRGLVRVWLWHGTLPVPSTVLPRPMTSAWIPPPLTCHAGSWSADTCAASSLRWRRRSELPPAGTAGTRILATSRAPHNWIQTLVGGFELVVLGLGVAVECSFPSSNGGHRHAALAIDHHVFRPLVLQGGTLVARERGTRRVFVARTQHAWVEHVNVSTES